MTKYISLLLSVFVFFCLRLVGQQTMFLEIPQSNEQMLFKNDDKLKVDADNDVRAGDLVGALNIQVTTVQTLEIRNPSVILQGGTLVKFNVMGEVTEGTLAEVYGNNACFSPPGSLFCVQFKAGTHFKLNGKGEIVSGTINEGPIAFRTENGLESFKHGDEVEFAVDGTAARVGNKKEAGKPVQKKPEQVANNGGNGKYGYAAFSSYKGCQPGHGGNDSYYLSQVVDLVALAKLHGSNHITNADGSTLVPNSVNYYYWCLKEWFLGKLSAQYGITENDLHGYDFSVVNKKGEGSYSKSCIQGTEQSCFYSSKSEVEKIRTDHLNGLRSSMGQQNTSTCNVTDVK